MVRPITDPALLAMLEGGDTIPKVTQAQMGGGYSAMPLPMPSYSLPDVGIAGGPKPITDANLLAQLEAPTQVTQPDLQQAFETKKGLIGRIGDDFNTRMNQAGQIADMASNGKISTPEAVVRGALKIPQTLVADVPIEIAKSAYDVLPSGITGPINQGVKSAASYIASTPVGDLAKTAISKYNQFEQNYPVAASRIGSVLDVGNIVAPFSPVGKGKSVASAIEDVAKQPVIAAGRAAIPNVEQGTLKLAQRAQDLGIPLKVSQISDSKPAKILNAVTEQLPFNGAQGFEQSQQAAFNRAVAKTIGQDAENLGPETINAFRLSNSEKYKNALEGNNVSFSSGFGESIDSIVDRAKKSVDPGLYSVIKANGTDLKTALKDGTIAGDKVNSIRSELIDRAASADGTVKKFLNDMVEHIDDAVADSLPAEKYSLLKQASREYRNFKTIEPLLEKSVDGNLSPALINQRVASSKFIKASRSEVGNDDLVDLGRIGQKFLKQQIPDSGTAGRVAYMKGLLQGGGTIGSAAVNLPATAAGLAAGRGLQALNRSQAIVDKSIAKALTKQELQRAFEARKAIK